MKPMAINQRVWSWFCICRPISNESATANPCQKCVRISLSVILNCTNVFILAAPFYNFINLTNTEDFFFALYRLVGVLMAINMNVVLILKRHKISSIFSKFTKVFNECKFIVSVTMQKPKQIKRYTSIDSSLVLRCIHF